MLPATRGALYLFNCALWTLEQNKRCCPDDGPEYLICTRRNKDISSVLFVSFAFRAVCSRPDVQFTFKYQHILGLWIETQPVVFYSLLFIIILSESLHKELVEAAAVAAELCLLSC